MPLPVPMGLPLPEMVEPHQSDLEGQHRQAGMARLEFNTTIETHRRWMKWAVGSMEIISNQIVPTTSIMTGILKKPQVIR